MLPQSVRRRAAATTVALAVSSSLLLLTACDGDDTEPPVAPTDAGTDSSLPRDATAPSDGATEASVAPDGSPGAPDGSDAATDGGSHSACVPGAALDPASDPCASTLCSDDTDFYCCTTSWDLSCVEAAHTLCPSECPDDPADGGIAKFGGTSHAIAQLTSRDGAECAVAVDGSVWCWGFEDVLGDGSEQPVSFPRQIVGLPVATASIAMAGSGICALGVDTTVRCWGRAPAGAPNGVAVTPPSSPLLPSVGGLAGDRLLGNADTSFFCALVASGVQCWGTADSTLGPGVSDPTPTPTAVDLSGAGLASTLVTNVFAGGQAACVLVGGGATPLCWGDNTTGMLGHTAVDGGAGTLVAPLACIPASNADGGANDCANALSGVVKIALGATSTCLIDESHAVWCLGDNSAGQLGMGTAGGSFPYPQAVPGLAASDVSVGATHACAAPLDASAPVVCWGSAASDQIGPAVTDGGVSASPVPVAGLTGVTALTASDGVTCALKSDGTVWCWGSNAQNQLGTGSVGAPSPTPVQVPFVSFP